MNITTIIFDLIGPLIGAVSSFYIWNKNKDKKALPYFLAFILAILIFFWSYFSKMFLHFHGKIFIINYYFIQTINILIAIFIGWLLIKNFVIDKINKK